MTYHPDVLSGPFIVEEIYRQTNGEAIILRKSDSIRCGRRNIINIQNQEHFLHQEGLERWDMVLVLHLERRSEDRKRR